QIAADYGEATHLTLKGGTPLEGPEGRAAFREGKKITKAKLRVNFRNQTFTMSFNALTFTLSGLKIPAPPNSSGPDYVFIRLEIFEEFEKFFDSVFEAYLKLRLNDAAWEQERKNIVSWVRNNAEAVH